MPEEVRETEIYRWNGCTMVGTGYILSETHRYRKSLS